VRVVFDADKWSGSPPSVPRPCTNARCAVSTSHENNNVSMVYIFLVRTSSMRGSRLVWCATASSFYRLLSNSGPPYCCGRVVARALEPPGSHCLISRTNMIVDAQPLGHTSSTWDQTRTGVCYLRYKYILKGVGEWTGPGVPPA